MGSVLEISYVPQMLVEISESADLDRVRTLHTWSCSNRASLFFQLEIWRTEKVSKNSDFECFHPVKRGSEIQTSLDSKWPKRGWVANGPDFKWNLKSNH